MSEVLRQITELAEKDPLAAQSKVRKLLNDVGQLGPLIVTATDPEASPVSRKLCQTIMVGCGISVQQSLSVVTAASEKSTTPVTAAVAAELDALFSQRGRSAPEDATVEQIRAFLGLEEGE